MASQRPAKKASYITSWLSNTTGLKVMLRPRNQLATLNSWVVPWATQMVALLSSGSAFTPSFLETMKPWPS